MRDPIFAHLRSGAREIADWAKGERTELADAMYRPRPQTKNPARESLRRHLQEAVANIDARKERR